MSAIAAQNVKKSPALGATPRVARLSAFLGAFLCASLWAAAPSQAWAESAIAEKEAPKKTRKAKPAEADEPVAPKASTKESARTIDAAPSKRRKGGADTAEEPAEAKETTAAGRRSKDAKPTDPMDLVRERLAERLGAAPVRDAHAVRVAAHSPAPTAAKVAAASKSPAAKAPGAHTPKHWGYQGEAGPESWGKLKPEFIKCSSGERQSPIDIRDGLRLQLDPVHFEYRPSGFRVIDNGHTVQVNVAGGNSIEVMGRRYSLQQFHFHRPSEERIDGRQFEMVAHLVHKDLEGRLAVVAVLIDQGSAHPVVQTIWNNLPLEKGEEVAARAMLDLNALLPTERNYFTYMGSLTTPPCSEGVLWLVMKQPVQISQEQIGIFARLYPMNARPVQSASGRLIKESN